MNKGLFSTLFLTTIFTLHGFGQATVFEAKAPEIVAYNLKVDKDIDKNSKEIFVEIDSPKCGKLILSNCKNKLSYFFNAKPLSRKDIFLLKREEVNELFSYSIIQ